MSTLHVYEKTDANTDGEKRRKKQRKIRLYDCKHVYIYIYIHMYTDRERYVYTTAHSHIYIDIHYSGLVMTCSSVKIWRHGAEGSSSTEWVRQPLQPVKSFSQSYSGFYWYCIDIHVQLQGNLCRLFICGIHKKNALLCRSSSLEDSTCMCRCSK